MSNLIPEVRADKDGKLVTRHVRAEAPAAVTRAFPAPVAQPAPKEESKDFQEVQAMLVNVLNHYRALVAEHGDDEGERDEDNLWRMDDDEADEIGFDPNDLLEPETIGIVLSEMPASTLERIRRRMDDVPYSDDYEIALLHVLSDEDADPQLGEYMTYLYDDLSNLYSHKDILADSEVNSYTLARDFVSSLRQYENVGYRLPENIFEATKAERDLMYALHDLNIELADDDGRVDEELVKLVIERPQDVERVIELAENRGTQDAAVIRSILETETPSLSSGIL